MLQGIRGITKKIQFTESLLAKFDGGTQVAAVICFLFLFYALADYVVQRGYWP